MCAGHRHVARHAEPSGSVCPSFLSFLPPPLPEPARKLVHLNPDCALESPGQLLSQHRPHPRAINSEFLGVGPRPRYCLKPVGDCIVQSSSRTPALEGPELYRPGGLCGRPVSGWVDAHRELPVSGLRSLKELAAPHPLQPGAPGPVSLPLHVRRCGGWKDPRLDRKRALRAWRELGAVLREGQGEKPLGLTAAIPGLSSTPKSEKGERSEAKSFPDRGPYERGLWARGERTPVDTQSVREGASE